MGGNCLKNTFTKRCSRSEFNLISHEVIELLKPYFLNVSVPRFYYNKESFGDIDIVCDAGTKDTPDIYKLISDIFKPNQIHPNGNVYSFDYKEIQIDLIKTNHNDYKSTLNYLSDNDLGNLISKLVGQVKFDMDVYGETVNAQLKYGSNGLLMKVHYKGELLGKFTITTDLMRVFNFFDLNYFKYKVGFDELSDIYDFVIESKFFSCEIFQLSNLTHRGKVRDKKRKTYSGFLNYIEKYKDTDKWNKYKYDEKELLTLLFFKFPEINKIKHSLSDTIKYIKLRDIAKNKFNANHITERYGLVGDLLGKSIINFKSEITKDRNYHEYIVKSDINEIYSRFESVNYL